jgi:hypothetical protein
MDDQASANDGKKTMRGPTHAFLFLLLFCSGSDAAERMRFLNKTEATIVELRLAPAGSENWGPNQTENDSDRAVDADEGLNLKGIAAGRYDVRLKDKTGRSCVVRDVAVNGGQAYALSISETDLKDCKR